MSLAEKTRAQALHSIRETAKSNTQRARLLCLYFEVWQSGVSVGGEEVRALTDTEVSHITGIQRGAVRPRRRELMGADHAEEIYQKVPLVEEHEKRYSKINRSEQLNVAYRWREGALDESKLRDILQHEALDDPLESYSPDLGRFTRPEHDCEKVADYTDVLPRGDVLWIGRVTEGLEEPYCLHFETDGRPPFVIALRKPGIKVFSTFGAVIEGRHPDKRSVKKIAREVRAEDFDPGGDF